MLFRQDHGKRTSANECLPQAGGSHECIKRQRCPHIDPSQWICCANQLTGFYMRTTLALKWLTGQNKNYFQSWIVSKTLGERMTATQISKHVQ